MAEPEREGELLERLARVLRERRFAIAAVPEAFDPDAAEAEILRGYGFPARPAPELEPARYALWRSMFATKADGRDVRFLANADVRPPGFGPSHRFAHGHPLPVGPSRHQRSLNWSGASISARGGMMFAEIHGAWQVPAVDAPSGADPGEYRSSTWIGLDGQRRYLAASLPQTGTAQFVLKRPDGTVSTDYSAWIQWWLRDDHLPPLAIANFPVAPGNLVRCAVYLAAPAAAGDPAWASFHIRNDSTGQQVPPIRMDAPATPVGRVPVTGATAAWVMERPTVFMTEQLYFMPDFGSVLFSMCQAAMRPSLDSATATVVDLAGARLIDMKEVRPGPRAAARKVTSSDFVPSARDPNPMPDDPGRRDQVRVSYR